MLLVWDSQKTAQQGFRSFSAHHHGLSRRLETSRGLVFLNPKPYTVLLWGFRVQGSKLNRTLHKTHYEDTLE